MTPEQEKIRDDALAAAYDTLKAVACTQAGMGVVPQADATIALWLLGDAPDRLPERILDHYTVHGMNGYNALLVLAVYRLFQGNTTDARRFLKPLMDIPLSPAGDEMGETEYTHTAEARFCAHKIYIDSLKKDKALEQAKSYATRVAAEYGKLGYNDKAAEIEGWVS